MTHEEAVTRVRDSLRLIAPEAGLQALHGDAPLHEHRGSGLHSLRDNIAARLFNEAAAHCRVPRAQVPCCSARSARHRCRASSG